MNLPNLTQIIESVVIFIAAGSFIISYNNLHESALQMGIPGLFAIIFPLTIDAFLIICTLYVLYAGRMSKSTWEGWLFLILYTIASIAFNVHMAPDDWWSRAGFAMCPIGLCIALHFLMRILEIEMGNVKIEVKKEVKDEVIVKEEIKEPEIPQELTSNQQKVRDVIMEEPGISMAEACRRTGLSFKTVKAHYNKLVEMGMI
ncbi:MAG: DUF2637 domain-containing protein [Methanothrix sp.]|nr:DUF2637 domain-containing protein [Methanothrix sp.]